MMLNFDYTASKLYCQQVGLKWLGDEWISAADHDAFNLAMTQEQVDCAMRHHLWQIKLLFTPRTYSLKQRILLAVHFLFGRNK